MLQFGGNLNNDTIIDRWKKKSSQNLICRTDHSLCWFATSLGTSSEISKWPPSQRAGRDQRKMQATSERQMAGLTGKGTYKIGCPECCSKNVSLLPAKSSKFIQRTYWGSFTYRESQEHITISRLCPWGSSQEQRRQVECTFQGQERGEKPPVARVHLTDQPELRSF